MSAIPADKKQRLADVIAELEREIEASRKRGHEAITKKANEIDDRRAEQLRSRIQSFAA